MSFLSPSTTLDEPWLGLTTPGQHFESTALSGKWCIYRDQATIDSAWIRVLAAVSTGALLAAKVSTKQSVMSGGFDRHVICVYTRNWQDDAEVRKVRDVLRDAGFEELLRYKRDIDTVNGDERFVYEE